MNLGRPRARALQGFAMGLAPLFLPVAARAQAPADAPAPLHSISTDRIPDAATGFDLALRIGVSVPFGDATRVPGDTLAARYGLQYPVALDVGFKPVKAIFVGAYGSLAYGGPGNDPTLSEACGRDDTSCTARSLGFGVFAQYNLGPSERYNAWFGLGFGWESTTQSFDQPEHSEVHETNGITAVRLSGGLDYRTFVGVGPFAEVAFGRFLGSETEVNDRRTHTGPIDEAAWHAWATLGIRGVLFP